MANKSEDDLEILRHRVKCPICMETFKQPKRLVMCSHVFCLSCIRRHMELHKTSNFPPCPMCRKPISTALKDIEKLEPARAEEDIITLVKKYDTCGICKKKENPSIKCYDCDILICDNCEPGHARYNAFHSLGDVFGTGKHASSVKHKTCKQHPEQQLVLFCIMCEQLLCLACDHRKCTEMFSEEMVSTCYEKGFFRVYVQSIGKWKTSPFENINLPRTVKIKDIAFAFRKFLCKVKPELNKCVEFFEEYKSRLTKLSHERNTSKIIIKKVQAIQTAVEAIDDVINVTKDTVARVSDIIEKSTDLQVAECILKIEEACLHVFRIRKRYSLDIQPLEIVVKTLQSQKEMASLVSSCKVQVTNGSIFSGMLNIRKDVESITQMCNDRQSLNFDNLVSLWKPKQPYDFNERLIQVQVDLHVSTKQTQTSPKRETAYYKTFGWNLYTCKTLRYENEDPFQSVLVTKISTGFRPKVCLSKQNYITESYISEDAEGNPFINISFDSAISQMSPYKYITSFINVLDLVFVFDTKGIRTRFDNFPDSGMVCIFGNRNEGAGLETLLINFSEGSAHTYAVCLNTRKAIFKADPSLLLKEEIHVNIVENDKGAFSLIIARSVNEENDDSTVAAYLSQVTESFTSKDFLIREERHSKSRRDISVSFMQFELLCSMEKGLYFAQYKDELNSILIGKLAPGQTTLDQDIILTVQQEDVDIELNKLKPLTMVENLKKEVVIVCSVEGYSTVFVMIWLTRKGPDAIELLEIKYSSPTFADSSVKDLEMDSDGNIMFVIVDKDGKHSCAFTKYIS